MKRVKVMLEFIKLNIPGKVAFGRNVQTQMSGNPLFASAVITPERIKAATDLLEARYVAAQNGGKQETAQMHQAEDEWENLMRKVARYVDDVADGDEVVILSAGFDGSKQPSPSQRQEFSVELGDKSGSVFLRHQAVTGARSYIWQHCPDPLVVDESVWITAEVTSRASITIEGLKPLTKYWFRAAVVTVQGTSAFCVPIMQAVI